MGNSAIAVFKPLYERILSATLQLQRGQGSSAELSSAFQADQVEMSGNVWKCLPDHLIRHAREWNLLSCLVFHFAPLILSRFSSQPRA